MGPDKDPQLMLGISAFGAGYGDGPGRCLLACSAVGLRLAGAEDSERRHYINIWRVRRHSRGGVEMLHAQNLMGRAGPIARSTGISMHWHSRFSSCKREEYSGSGHGSGDGPACGAPAGGASTFFISLSSFPCQSAR